MADIAIGEKKLAKTLKRRLYREYEKQDNRSIKPRLPTPLEEVLILTWPQFNSFRRKQCDKAIDNNICALKYIYKIKARIRERERLKPSSEENDRLKQALEDYLERRLLTVAEDVTPFSALENVKIDAATLNAMLYPPKTLDWVKDVYYRSYLLSPVKMIVSGIATILALVIATPLYYGYLGCKKLFGTRQQEQSKSELNLSDDGGSNLLATIEEDKPPNDLNQRLSPSREFDFNLNEFGPPPPPEKPVLSNPSNDAAPPPTPARKKSGLSTG